MHPAQYFHAQNKWQFHVDNQKPNCYSTIVAKSYWNLHIVVPYIWDPFGNLTVVRLQSATGSYKACMSSLGAKLLDAPVSTKKSTVSPYILPTKYSKLPRAVVSLAVSTIFSAASGHAHP